MTADKKLYRSISFSFSFFFLLQTANTAECFRVGKTWVEEVSGLLHLGERSVINHVTLRTTAINIFPAEPTTQCIWPLEKWPMYISGHIICWRLTE